MKRGRGGGMEGEGGKGNGMEWGGGMEWNGEGVEGEGEWNGTWK